MKIINLGRGQGKTTRLLYASEFNNIPILCQTSTEKQFLKKQAERYGLKIPEPISVGDIASDKLRGSNAAREGVLVDDAPYVLQRLLSVLGMNSEIKAITLTSQDE